MGNYTRTRTTPIVGYPTRYTWYHYQDGVKNAPIDYSKKSRYATEIGKVKTVDGRIGTSTVAPISCLNTQLGLAVNTNAAYPWLYAAERVAFERFREKIFDTVDLGVALAERRDSINMVAVRSMQMFRAFKGLKKGNFREFSKHLQVRPLNKHRKTKWTKPKDASAIWLEYHFGWSPLIGDIKNAIDVLQGAWPNVTCKAIGLQQQVINISPSINTAGLTTSAFGTVKHFCVLEADVRVNNPTLALANQAGLVNPLQVAWELVPFSFVIDWFVPVGQYLSYGTSFAGLDLTNRSKTYYSKGKSFETRLWRPGQSTQWKALDFCEAHKVERSLTIGLPKLDFWSPKGLSPSRAATAVSLLISIFRRG